MRPQTEAPYSVFRFADVEVCETDFSVTRDGSRLALEPKALKVLLYFLRHPGRVIRKDELLDAVWGDTAVTEDSLVRTIVMLRRLLGDDRREPRFIETVATLGYRFICPVGEAVRSSRLRVNSLAVLPFENLSRDPEQDYFADGMTEALICTLSGIQALRVISRTTAMRFRQTQKRVPEIARELDVDAVVEGTVSRYDNRVRVTVNLVQAPTDQHLWSGSYEAEWKDVLALQNSLARTIAEKVEVELTPEDHAQLAFVPQRTPEAYECYLKATYSRKRSAGGLVAGIQHFRDAIACDPRYAEAYLGLALAYLQMGFGYGPLSPAEAFRESRQAAQSALRLDARLIEAQSCCAWVRAFGDWDWLGADRDFRHAIQSDSNSAEAHRLYAWYLSAMCRHDEAISHAIKASELEPDSMTAEYALGAAYLWAHRYGELTAQVEKIEQMDPTFPGAARLHAVVGLYAGSYDEAIRQYQREFDLCGNDLNHFGLAYLGYSLGRAGKFAEARAALNRLQSAGRLTYVSPYLLAILHTGLGDDGQAFAFLESARRERNPMLAFIRVDPHLDPLRSDPRFSALLLAMNFPRQL
jgi:TolB-like protein/Tfp pilus assembly protein PilF